MKSKLALVVMSCDAYMDVADYFFMLKEKYMPWWDGTCIYVNDTAQFIRSGVHTINGGKGIQWSGRLRNALSQINEKYILYMQEDYFIGESVNKMQIEAAIDFMEKNNVWYYKIDNLVHINSPISKDKKYLSYIPSNKRYGINLLTALIRKDKFYELLNNDEMNAWQVEASFLKNVTNRFEYNLPGCIQDRRNIIDVHYAIRQGKWDPTVVKYFKRKGILIDTKQRGTLSGLTILKYKCAHSVAKIIPTGLFRIIKILLSKIGVKFITKM